MTITVEIPDHVITLAVNTAVEHVFRRGDSYRGESGEGYRLIVSQVENAVKTLDLKAIVLDSIQRRLKREVVDEEVDAALRKRIREAVKAKPALLKIAEVEERQ